MSTLNTRDIKHPRIVGIAVSHRSFGEAMLAANKELQYYANSARVAYVAEVDITHEREYNSNRDIVYTVYMTVLLAENRA